MTGYGGGICAHAKPSSGDLLLRSPRRPRARATAAKPPTCTAMCGVLITLSMAARARRSCWAGRDFRQRQEVRVLMRTAAPALENAHALRGHHAVARLQRGVVQERVDMAVVAAERAGGVAKAGELGRAVRGGLGAGVDDGAAALGLLFRQIGQAFAVSEAMPRSPRLRPLRRARPARFGTHPIGGYSRQKWRAGRKWRGPS